MVQVTWCSWLLVFVQQALRSVSDLSCFVIEFVRRGS